MPFRETARGISSSTRFSFLSILPPRSRFVMSEVRSIGPGAVSIGGAGPQMDSEPAILFYQKNYLFRRFMHAQGS